MSGSEHFADESHRGSSSGASSRSTSRPPLPISFSVQSLRSAPTVFMEGLDFGLNLARRFGGRADRQSSAHSSDGAYSSDGQDVSDGNGKPRGRIRQRREPRTPERDTGSEHRMGGEMFAGLGNERQPEKDTDFERQAKHKGTIVQEEHMQRQDGKEREVADEVRIQTHREDLERQERMTQQQRITEGEQRNCGRSIEEQSRHEGDVQNQPSEYGRTKSSPIDLWQEPQAPLDNECSDQSFQSSVAEQPKVLEIFHSPPLTTDAVIQRSRSSGIMVDTGHLSVTSPDATALHQSLQTRSKSAPPRAYESAVWPCHTCGLGIPVTSADCDNCSPNGPISSAPSASQDPSSQITSQTANSSLPMPRASSPSRPTSIQRSDSPQLSAGMRTYNRRVWYFKRRVGRSWRKLQPIRRWVRRSCRPSRPWRRWLQSCWQTVPDGSIRGIAFVFLGLPPLLIARMLCLRKIRTAIIGSQGNLTQMLQ